jgi:hypothetical protein
MNTTDTRRNKPTEQGRDNDSTLRDESAIQPGVNTISDSDNDRENENLTQTAKEDFREDEHVEPKPDPSFDEVDYD